MHPIDPRGHTRRAFLRRSGHLALAGSALPFALNLAALGEAAAQASDGDGYRALVCVFLQGGNDHANTFVAYDPETYLKYSAIRGGQGEAGGGLAIPRAQLGNTVLHTQNPADGRRYALHPAMHELAQLYNQTGHVALLQNVGPLVIPLTRAQYQSGNTTVYPVPPKLFSHNDQQSVWQSASPEGSIQGWGGHLGDLALSSNGQAQFTCISAGGNAVFLAGDRATPFQIGERGAVRILSLHDQSHMLYRNHRIRPAMQKLMLQSRPHLLEDAYRGVVQRSLDSEGVLGAAMGEGLPGFPDTRLGRQLQTVARLIRGRGQLGLRRQVFFVAMDGFDLHDGLMNLQPQRLEQLSAALSAFYRQMAGWGLGQQVTAFTASDFGRTLSINGNGTDHGWGAHHMVVGGAVQGHARHYGRAPAMSIANDPGQEGYADHVGQGRWIPTTSVDQYAATLARWFGVPEGDLARILPNLRHFGGSDYPTDLGFMHA